MVLLLFLDADPAGGRPFAGQCPERMAGMKTVADIKKKIPFQRNKYGRTPTAKALERSGLAVIEQACFENDTVLRVYENGFVTYRTEGRYTVFRLYDVPDDYEECCGSRFYSSFAEDGSEIASEQIVLERSRIQIPWEWHLRMYAQERIVRNLTQSDRKAARKLAQRYFPQKEGVRKENAEAMRFLAQQSWEEQMIQREMLDLAYSLMTPKQRKVFVLYLEYRMTYRQIAKELDMDINAVGMLIKRAKEQLRKNKEKFQ